MYSSIILGITLNDETTVSVMISDVTSTAGTTLMMRSVHSVKPPIFLSKYIIKKYFIRSVLSIATNQSVFILITITSSTIIIVIIIVIVIIVIATSITVYWRKKKRQQYEVGGTKNVIN